ncbi:transmembrane protein 229B [Hyperolius riggenbachi]|uniref:transmembrane protein 229B n=1 Tax=Hyperolius riggenbachi TaxID=752182 RepID=UPI0035A2D86E
MQKSAPLGGAFRWYIYALHGLLCEILFTAAWDLCTKRCWRLIGVSSFWAIFIYGTAIFVIEKLSLHLQKICPLPYRCLIYTMWTYLWEFSTGYTLRTLGACPWDYSHFLGNFMGLVTLEYAVPWYFGCMIAEQVVIKYTLRLRLPQETDYEKCK